MLKSKFILAISISTVLALSVGAIPSKAEEKSKDEDKNVITLDAGVVGNSESNSGDKAMGVEIGASFYSPNVPMKNGRDTLKLSGTLGKTNLKTTGGINLDLSRIAPGKKDFSTTATLGLNASGQVTRIDFYQGVSLGSRKGTTNVMARLPMLGGAIFDRQTGAAFLATGLNINSLINLTPKLDLNASTEVDYLFSGKSEEDSLNLDDGVYMAQNLGLTYQITDQAYLKVDGSLEAMKFKSKRSAPVINDMAYPDIEVDDARFALTGKASVGAKF